MQITDLLYKKKDATALMDRTLSCLSCLKMIGTLGNEKNLTKGVYDSSMIDAEGTPCITLECGHSICKNCFETHSDPKSKESLVFCEDCHHETKNKNLRELKTFRNLSQSWKVLREAFVEIQTNL